MQHRFRRRLLDGGPGTQRMTTLERARADGAVTPGTVDRRDLDACREVIRVHSRSFHAASRLLPASMRAS